MSDAPISIGSRGSALALAQARIVAAAFSRQGHATEIIVLETDGDRRSPDTAWGEGAFVAAIERALLARRIDVAVHSAKDIPTDEDERLRIGAYLPRADPRDALVVRGSATATSLEELPSGSRVGTDSPRRTGFILALRPDLVVHPLHGNVDTRLRRLDEGETDALILACAGLDRLDRSERIAARLEPGTVPPAPAQGAIAVQVRGDDERVIETAAGIDDAPTRLAVETERAFLRASGGGCRAPIGALATVVGGTLGLLGGVAEPDGSRTAIEHREGDAVAAASIAAELARTLVGAVGSRRDRVERTPFAGRPRVLVTRAREQATSLIGALAAHGLDAVHVPAIGIEDGGRDLDAAIGSLATYAWALVTSANGARAAIGALARTGSPIAATRWAAVGPATGAVIEAAEGSVAFMPDRATGAALAEQLPAAPGERLLLVQGDLADGSVGRALRARGMVVEEVVAYRTVEAPEGSRTALRRAFDAGPVDLLLFTSGSTVRGLAALAAVEAIEVRAIAAVCIGRSTAEVARQLGFRVLAMPETPGDAGLAATAARLLRPNAATAR